MRLDYTVYFPELATIQQEQLLMLEDLCVEWNKKINVISRKDTGAIAMHHILHSLGIAKAFQFLPKAEVMDVGTGGGLPGVPLAIAFPEVHFHLVDSIEKKVTVVKDVVHRLKLKNVTVEHKRVEQVDGQFDFIVSRAVAAMSKFVKWIPNHIKKEDKHSRMNGIFYLKGGDLSEEMKEFNDYDVTELGSFFCDFFFETKKVVYLSREEVLRFC